MSNIAVVIPSYKVTRHILGVIQAIGPEVTRIYVVDDKCPDGSGDFVTANCRDQRVTVLFNPVNLGVGGCDERVSRGSERRDGCDRKGRR